MTCWAAPLGGCEDKISREHVVSAALWESPAIDVVGLPWCKEKPKRVGVSSLTAKILCRTHNSELSEVDAAGAAAFEAFRKAARIQNQREKKPRKRYKIIPLFVDGSRLERWLLKTLINVGASRGAAGQWRFNKAPLTEPPVEFVRAAFGRSQLEPPLGLYGVATVGETILSMDALELTTLLDLDGLLVGALFKFRGVRFFLNLAPGEIPREARLPSGEEWVPSALLHHVVRINSKVRGKWSHEIRFKWGAGGRGNRE